MLSDMAAHVVDSLRYLARRLEAGAPPRRESSMKRLIVDTHASSCYLRTSVRGAGRKALVQITERCNLHCAHCFVSPTQVGSDLSHRITGDEVGG